MLFHYVQKRFTISAPRSEANPKYHGTGGPLGVLEGRDYPEISSIFLEAGKELGYTVSWISIFIWLMLHGLR